MKKTLLITATIISSLALIFNYPLGSAAIYSSDQTQTTSGKQYQGDDEYITKIKMDPFKRKPNLWSYIVKACATDRSIPVVEVILKSDMEKVHLGVNKIIPKGSCSYYGAVMSAKNGNTLGAEIIEVGEAINRIGELKKNLSQMSKQEFKTAWEEIMRYKIITGW